MSGEFVLNEVSFRYNENLPFVLKDISTAIPQGSRTAILGANGTGKTTLFYCLTGVYRPTEGAIMYNDQPIGYTREGLTRLRSEVAIVLQNPDEQMFSSTVEEDVAFGPMNLGLEGDEVSERIDRALKEVRMSDYRHAPLQRLSGGQRKRVAIAGALAVRPKVMIMDEPTAGLDPQSALEVMELAQKLHLMGTTVIISTHGIDNAYGWADSVLVLGRGHMIYRGDSEGFYENNNEVLLSGLLRPSTFNMNKELSMLGGMSESPFPKSVSEYLSKFGRDSPAGRMFCVPYSGGRLSDLYGRALSAAGKRALVGIYGFDAREAVSDEKLRADFYFDGIDSCLSETVLGRDSVLVYDRIYEPYVKEKIERLALFEDRIETEMV